MKIKQIETSLYRIPPKIALSGGTIVATHFEAVITKITTDEGLEGYGYAYTIGLGGPSIKALIDDLTPMLIGKNPEEVEAIWKQLWVITHPLGAAGISQFAVAAIDIALWDIVAKIQKKPLHKVLGGYTNELDAYASGLYYLTEMEELKSEAAGYLERGFTAMKMRGGRGPKEDLQRFEEFRKWIGDDIGLMVDGNQGWDVKTVISMGSRLEALNLTWLEEPLWADDISGHGFLASQIRVPIAIGESLYNKYQFNEYFKINAAGFVQADVLRVGGVTEWMKIAKLAESYNLQMAPHYNLEISAQLMGAIPNGFMVEYLDAIHFSDFGLLKTPLIPHRGKVKLSEEPGNGLEFDEEALKPYKVY